MSYLLTHKTYLGCFLGGLFLAFVVTPLIRHLALRWGMVDAPSHRKIHSQATPLMGGLAIFMGMWLPILALCFLDNDVTARLQGRWSEFAVVALAGLAVMLSGVIDDLHGLNAHKKLLVQVPLALFFAVFVVHFDKLTIPWLGSIDLGAWGVPLTIAWIVGITNALNLIDGIDGLAAGVAFFVAVSNAAIAVLGGNDFLALIMLGMAGACLGFLYFNFSPARIFLGDTGSLFLGMTLATTSVLANTKSRVAASMLVAVIVLAYPVLDTLLAMARRGLRGKPIFSADRSHIHHRLLARGLDHRHAAMIIYVFCAVFGLLALSITAQNSMLTFISLLAAGAIMALGLRFLGLGSFFLARDHKQTRARFQVAHHLGEMIRAKLALAKTREQIYSLLETAGAEFSLFSMDIELDPDKYPRESGTSHGWTNADMDEGDNGGNGGNGGGPIREEVLLSPDHGLKVCVRYNHVDESGELSTEHLLQMSRIVEASSSRLKELYPVQSPAEAPMHSRIGTPFKQAIGHALVMGRGMPGRIKNGRSLKRSQLQ